MLDERILTWVRKMTAEAEFVLSVCTGARILAKAGVLDGLTATSHHEAFDDLRELAPNVNWKDGDWQETRFVDNGNIITSGGVTAGIDMSLYVVSKLLGRDKTRVVAEYMEYEASFLSTPSLAV
jgi:transcriptional regulator GlxA family with amidase domain